jgi:hypothetical protein
VETFKSLYFAPLRVTAFNAAPWSRLHADVRARDCAKAKLLGGVSCGTLADTEPRTGITAMGQHRVRFRDAEETPIRAYARANGNLPLTRAIAELARKGLALSHRDFETLINDLLEQQRRTNRRLDEVFAQNTQLLAIARAFAIKQNPALYQHAIEAATMALRPSSAVSTEFLQDLADRLENRR